jgi:hypothetical protein
MRDRKRHTPTKAELRAMGVTPGLMAHRVGPDGRARLEELAPESTERRQQFARRLIQDTKDTPASEGSKTA